MCGYPLNQQISLDFWFYIIAECKSPFSLVNDKIPAMKLLKDRIRLALQDAATDQSSLARQIGVSAVAVNNWCTGTVKSMRGETLMKVALALNVNPDWMASGSGAMHSSAHTPADLFPRPASEDDYLLIPQYLPASSHHFAHHDEAIRGGLAFKRDWLIGKSLNEQNACVIYIRGNNMSPTANDGDALLLDQTKQVIRSGEVYAILMGDEIVIRRIAKEFGVFMLRGDNPNKAAYPDISVPPEHELQIIGHVVWRGGSL